MQMCAGCKKEKLANKFHKNGSRTSGLNSYCKDCRHANQRSSDGFSTVRSRRASGATAAQVFVCILCGEAKNKSRFTRRSVIDMSRPVCFSCRDEYSRQYDLDPRVPFPRNLIIAGKKRCSACKIEQLISRFGKDHSAPFGIHRRCNDCVRTKDLFGTLKPLSQEEREAAFFKKRLRHHKGVNVEEVLALYRKDRHCQYCRIELNFENLSIDHRTPVSRNGSQSTENIAMCCWVCNRAKGSMAEMQYRVWLVGLSARLNQNFSSDLRLKVI